MYQNSGYLVQKQGYKPSGLEAAVKDAVVRSGSYVGQTYKSLDQRGYVALSEQHNQTPVLIYESDSTISANKLSEDEKHSVYHTQQSSFVFLNHSRTKTPFIADASDISNFIREAFVKATEKELPRDITITITSRELLKQIHKQFLNDGVVGLSFNGTCREIFVVAGNMDEVMLTVGHELGHVVSKPLQDSQAEEAKAFAFETAWAKTIFLNNIAGLRNSINEAAVNMKPAENGLHNLAFEFVKAATIAGKEPLDLHSHLSQHGKMEFGQFAPLHRAYTPLVRDRGIVYGSGGYRNKSFVHNVPWFTDFTWTNLGKGVYGMYIPSTASIFMNDQLLRTNLEQFHKTLGHEYVLHHVMQLPDGYTTEVLEDAIFWIGEDDDKYKPRSKSNRE
jgi:uncharacterized protein YheU (UPF0270 family)